LDSTETAVINSKLKFLVVGTISNASKRFQPDMDKIAVALSSLGRVEYFLVESDSHDSTPRILKTLKAENLDFDFKSLGELRTRFPDRIERIRHCRNVYVEYIRNKYSERKWDYVVVADLDGMNSRVTTAGVKSSISKMNNWDALFANQKHGYYDLFALRSSDWVECDLLKILRVDEGAGQEKSQKRNPLGYLRNQKIRQEVLYSKMRRIPRDSEVIRVDSAFGGLGIYKTEMFLEFDYSLTDGELPDGSEHLTFHQKCIDEGFSLGINPEMINATYNEYNINKHYLIRFLKDFKRNLRHRKAG
jgi:hypothetical protein